MWPPGNLHHPGRLDSCVGHLSFGASAAVWRLDVASGVVWSQPIADAPVIPAVTHSKVCCKRFTTCKFNSRWNRQLYVLGRVWPTFAMEIADRLSETRFFALVNLATVYCFDFHHAVRRASPRRFMRFTNMTRCCVPSPLLLSHSNLEFVLSCVSSSSSVSRFLRVENYQTLQSFHSFI